MSQAIRVWDGCGVGAFFQCGYKIELDERRVWSLNDVNRCWGALRVWELAG